MPVIHNISAEISGEPPDDGPVRVHARDLDLCDLWAEFTSGTDPWTYEMHMMREKFPEHVQGLALDPVIGDVKFCDSCGDPAWVSDTIIARGNSRTRICESCSDEWDSCDSCCEWFPETETTQTLGELDVCDDCRSNYYTYCDHCEGYYNDADSDDHVHGSSNCCCASPQLKFAVRNDGAGMLWNDTRATVTLPEGTISAEGLAGISNYLQRRGYDRPDLYSAESSAYRELAYSLETLGDQWQTREGNYAKRLSRRAYQAHNLKLTPEVMSAVGCIASDHSKQVNVTIEVTRELNRSADYFYHEDSCWWSSYSESRCALKSSGGFGMLTFRPHTGNVSGRAWVMPLKTPGSLTATFSTETASAFVIFNGYGDLSGYAAPRVMAHMTGWTYRKVAFSCDPMYVNAGGYLVAPEEIARDYTDGALDLNVSQHSNLFHEEQTS